MKSKIKRRQEENNKKLQKHAKGRAGPDSDAGDDLRQSPAAKKLAALREKKARGDS